MGMYDEFYKNNPQFEDRGGTAYLRGTGATGITGGVPYSDLASGVNTFMTGQAKAPFVANLPDYENLVAQRSKNIGSQLKGEVPQDVQDQIINTGAERGVAMGIPGSQNANAAWLKALGLTSIGQQEAGSKGLTQSIADTPVPQLWNPMSLFVPQTLARDELAAAQAGLGAGTRGRSTGAYGGSSIQLPGGSLGSSSSGPASWERGQPPAVGVTGPFMDSNGLWNSPTFSGGMWTGGNSSGGGVLSGAGAGAGYGNYFGAGGGAGAMGGNLYGGGGGYSNFNDPYDPSFWGSDVGGDSSGDWRVGDDWWDL